MLVVLSWTRRERLLPTWLRRNRTRSRGQHRQHDNLSRSIVSCLLLERTARLLTWLPRLRVAPRRMKICFCGGFLASLNLKSHPKISSCHMEKRECRADKARKAPEASNLIPKSHHATWRNGSAVPTWQERLPRRALLPSLTLLSLRPRKHALQGLG